MTRAEVVAKLEGSGLPFAPIGKPEDMFDDPQLAEGGLEPVTLDRRNPDPPADHPLADGRQASGRSATSLPEPGADSRAVLTALGYPAEQIDELLVERRSQENRDGYE